MWKMEVPAPDSGHPGTKVLTQVWTSEGEQDTEILSIRANGESFHMNNDGQKTFSKIISACILF